MKHGKLRWHAVFLIISQRDKGIKERIGITSAHDVDWVRILYYSKNREKPICSVKFLYKFLE